MPEIVYVLLSIVVVMVLVLVLVLVVVVVYVADCFVVVLQNNFGVLCAIYNVLGIVLNCGD